MDFSRGIRIIMSAIVSSNKYFQQFEPWKLAKRTHEDPNAADKLSTILCLTLQVISSPFMD
jgi:methionyl-tRNA synthetase